jgi:hypothetical protein
MREDQILLHFETLQGAYPDTTLVARALIDWVDLVQKTIAAISPTERVIIEMVGVKEGSTRFPQLLKFIDSQFANVHLAWSEYPYLKSMVAGSAHTLYTAVVAASVTLALQPKEQIVRLSDVDRALLEPLKAIAAADPAVKDASTRFYRTLENEQAITGVGVSENWIDRPAFIVPRSEFAERGGLWEIEADESEGRTQRETWEVVLLRPSLVSRPQPWQFSRGGLKFSAQMIDAQFLLALREGRIPLNMQEGVVMSVEVEYQETQVGQVWEVVARSRKIVRVLTPVARPQTPAEEP